MFQIRDAKIGAPVGARALGRLGYRPINLVQSDLCEPSAQISGRQGESESILVAMDAGIYNVQKATCGSTCHTCAGAVDGGSAIVDDPFAVATGGAHQLSFQITWSTGGVHDYTASSNWTSQNTVVGTVSAGLVNGVAPGSLGITALAGAVPQSQAQQCWATGTPPPACPKAPALGSSSGTVLPTVTFSGIPSVLVGQTATTTASVSPSSNALPISLSITSPAAIVSPTGTFTKTTPVVVKGMSVGTATITATVPNSDGGNPTPVGSTSFQVIPPPPVISGGNTVWWFNGQHPSGYSTSVTLQSSGGSSTAWSVSGNAAAVQLSTTTGSSTTVNATSAAWSGTPGDVMITATVNSQSSQPFGITSRKPYKLVAGTIQDNCDSTYGYSDFLNYTIYDQLSTALPSGIPINENWTTGIVNDYSGANWRRQDPGNFTTSGAGFSDHIQGEASGFTPTAVCSGSGVAVQHWGQDWYIGSLTTASGVRVQSDTLQKYIDHALHQSIVSPAP